MNDSLLEYKLDLVAAHLGVYRIDEVAAVMRRQHVAPEDGRIVDVIDFYPEWNAFGTYGKMKLCHEYLDEEWQVKRFEKYAGVTLDSLPIYDGQTALVRRFGQTHRCETAVRPFRLMVQPRTDDNGNNAKTLILRYLASPKARQGRMAQPQPTAVTQPAANGQAASGPTPNGSPQRPLAPNQKIHADQMLAEAGVNIHAPAAKSAAGVTPAEWLERARVATDPFDFDTCVARGLYVGNATYFETADHAEKARTGLFGEWNGAAAAYLAGLKKYVIVRTDLQAAGEPGTAVFAQAKSAALVAFRQVVDGVAA